MTLARHIALSVVLLGLVAAAAAQTNISIKGKAENAAGKTVTLGGYTDRISGGEVELDRVQLGDDQQFELRCYANYPRLVYLQIENYSQSFYVVPGGDYVVRIPHFGWDQDDTVNVLLHPVTLPVEFLRLPLDDVNGEISRFDVALGQYLTEHAAHFDERYHPERRYFDSLLAAMERVCPDTEHDFFNRYKRYTLAQLRMDMKFASRRKTYDLYLGSQPVLPYDDNYMSLFVSLYQHFISKGTRKVPLADLQRWVAREDYAAFIDALGAEPMLRHEQIRELAALLALKEMYYDRKHFEPQHVRSLIATIGSRTKFADHRPLATNLLNALDKVRAGQAEAVDFALPDANKDRVALSSFKGKWVYLSFVRVQDAASQGEIETLAFFKDTLRALGDNVAFVTVDCDREFQRMYHFLRNSKHGERYDWTWLHFDGNYDLLRHFQVVSFPTFVLLNPDGEVCYDITPAPSTGFLLSPPWRKKTSAPVGEGAFLPGRH